MIPVISDETSTNGIFEPTYMSFSEKLSGKCEDANHRACHRTSTCKTPQNSAQTEIYPSVEP
jgi:hypothetical protein